MDPIRLYLIARKSCLPNPSYGPTIFFVVFCFVELLKTVLVSLEQRVKMETFLVSLELREKIEAFF